MIVVSPCPELLGRTRSEPELRRHNLLQLPHVAYRSLRTGIRCNLCDQDRACATREQGLDAVWHAFYVGDVVHQILAHQRANDELLAAADLAEFRTQILPALTRTYNLGGESVKVHACGAWSQGPLTHEVLAMRNTLTSRRWAMGPMPIFTRSQKRSN